jgi:hypothetical protein
MPTNCGCPTDLSSYFISALVFEDDFFATVLEDAGIKKIQIINQAF